MSRKSTSAASKSNNFMGSEDGWNQASTKELLQKMKMAIPRPDVIKYKTMLLKLDWEKIQFGKFSVKDCQDQWTRVYKKLKKFKTLSDLVSESFEYIENPYKGNVKKHPDHPKRPLTPYFRFFLGEREKYAKLHKDLTNLEITNILSKKYREISIEEKENLESKWRGQMIEYKKQLEEFKKNHPEYYDKSPPKVSRTPIAIFNQEQMVAMTRSKKKMSKKQLQESLKNKYHDLDDDQKLPYILKAIEEWEKYKEELEMYKKSHQEFVPTDRYTKSVLTISDWRIHDKNLGKPDRPPANGYNLFCTRMMVSDSMKHLSSRDRIMQCGQKWKLLTDAEKAAYQEEFLKMRDNYRTAQKNFLSSLTPRQREEYLERKKETETKRNLKRKIPIQIKVEVPSESDSDESDDEEMEVNDDSSSESSSSESSDEEEEEEEPSAKKTKSPSPTKITSPAPLRPTTPISALFLYQKAHREKFAAKHPNVSKNDITIMLARRFNNLPQEKKAKYIQKEKEQRALYNEQMRKHLLGESAKKDAPAELRPVTGEQIFQEQSKAAYLKKAGGSEEKAQEIMRKAWTQMNKERRKKYINIAHEQNAKNIAQHQAAVAASKKQNENVAEPAPPVERNLSQKEIKSYLALEPKKVPNNGLLLFKMEHRVKLNHLKPSARTQELSRLWEASSQADKNKYKEKAKTGMAEYNKKIQRWIKSLPPQALEAYKAKLAKSKTKQAASKASVANGGAKKRKAETAQTKASKKSKKEESEESSDDSSDDDDSSSDSDDDSDSSDSDDSSDDSSSSDEDALPANQSKKQESSGDSSSSDEDDSGSD